MTKKKSIILFVIMAAVCIAVPIMAVFRGKNASADDGGSEMSCITVWQIDGFEGGKGSRAQFLSRVGERCFKDENIYVSVSSLSSDMARENLKTGNLPDMISFPAGFYGLEEYIKSGEFSQSAWCNGSYCLLTIDESADFTDVSAENTVVNEGKDNLANVAVAMCGLNGSKFDAPTNAYLNLLNGKYKYLFGTQRDVFRLKTRGATFKIKPVTQFNDLYQNIAITCADASKTAHCRRYIEFLMKNGDVSGLGLFSKATKECAEGLTELAGLSYQTQLTTICSENFIGELKACAKDGEINKIKNLLK